MQKSARRKAAVLVTTGAAAMAFGLGPGAVAAHAFDDWDDKGCAQRDGWDDRGWDDRGWDGHGRDDKGCGKDRWKDGHGKDGRESRDSWDKGDRVKDDGWDRGKDRWKDGHGKDGRESWDKGDRVKDDEWDWHWDW